MRIVELRRTGAGTFAELTKFEWSGPSHSSMQGTLDLELAIKTVRKEMPGGNEVIEQGLSSTWQPFEMTGEWDDKWAGAGFAMQMYNDFAPFCARIPFIRFTLDEHSLIGLITNLKIKYKTAAKIFWTLTLSPHRNETFTDEIQFAAPKERKPIDQWWKQFQANLATFASFRAGARKIPLSTDVLTKFDTFMADLNGAVDELGHVATNGLESDTERRLLRLASTFRKIRGAGLRVAFGIQKQASTVDVAYDDVMGTLTYDEWVNTARTQLWRNTGLARLAELDMQARVGHHPKAIYRPKSRESLERISKKFYGTPGNVDKIRDANPGLPNVLIGTEELLIPELAA
jgi:hypothetical protein